MNDNRGMQSIGCEVTSCRFNKQGDECDLPQIQVKPCCDCHTGDSHETLCASYLAK